MTAIIELLNEKNETLVKFHEVNEQEMAKISNGQFDTLEQFYKTREGLLDIIKKIDEMIDTEEAKFDSQEIVISAEMQKAVVVALDQKNEIVMDILEQDLLILSAIETYKSNLLKEVAQVRSAKKAIGAYHSGGAAPQIDEEI